MPRHISGDAADGVLAAEPDVEAHDDEDEEAKHEKLEDETPDHDVLAHFQAVLLRLDARPARLDQEAEDVAKHEDARRPSRRDDRVTCSADRQHAAPVRHVEGGREEDRREQEKDGLHEIGDELAGRIVARCATRIANDLDCARTTVLLATQPRVYRHGEGLVQGQQRMALGETHRCPL